MLKCTAWLCCSGCVCLCMACLASVLGSLIVRRLVLLLAVLSLQLLDFPVPVATKFAVPTAVPFVHTVQLVTGENASPTFFSYLYNYGTNLCQSPTSHVLHLNQPLMFVGACHFKGSIGAWLVDAPMFTSIMVQFWYKWFCDPPTRNRLQNGSSEAGTMFCYFVANDFNSCPLLGSCIFSLHWVVIVCLEPFFIAQFNLCILLAWLRWYICLVCDTVITSTRWKNQVQTKVNIDCFLIIDYSVMCLLLVTFFL